MRTYNFFKQTIVMKRSKFSLNIKFLNKKIDYCTLSNYVNELLLL